MHPVNPQGGKRPRGIAEAGSPRSAGSLNLLPCLLLPAPLCEHKCLLDSEKVLKCQSLPAFFAPSRTTPAEFGRLYGGDALKA